MRKTNKKSIFILILSGVALIWPLLSGQAHAACPDKSDEIKLIQNDARISQNDPSCVQLMTASAVQAGTVEENVFSKTILNYSELKESAVKEIFRRFGFNKVVNSNIHYYVNNKRSFSTSLNRAGRYVDTISAVFIQKGLPAELAYLPLIESGFKTHAYSYKNASGLWQFIPATARKYGLKIDPWVDERRDPVKATVAAAEYLKDMYERFGSWNLALAAYNAGEGKIGAAIRKYKNNDYWKIRRTRYIVRETKKYVPAFVAAAAIATYPEKYGFTTIDYHEPLRYEEVVIDTPMDLETVAGFTGVSLPAIIELNPELKYWCTPLNVSDYTLRIPEGTKESFLRRIAGASEDDLFHVRLYRVKNGDTVGGIAIRLNSSSHAIIEMNSLGRDALIIAGKDILVPINRSKHKEGDKVVFLQRIIRSRNL